MTETLIVTGLLIGLIVLGMPVAIVLGIVSVVGLFTMFGLDIPVDLVAQRMFYGVNSFLLVAVPFFMLAGEIMNRSGATMRLYRFADALVGHLPGGLAHVNILGSLIFAGMSGSAAADAAGLGKIEHEAMVKKGFPPSFAVGLTASSATVGPIVPPSIPMIVYAVMSGTSVGALFIAGIVPGVLICAILAIMVFFWGMRADFPRNERFAVNEVLISLKGAILPMMGPAIVLGGIFGGLFTPTEASVVAVLYTAFLGIAVYREISIQDLVGIIKQTAVEVAPLMLVVATASLFGYVIVRLGVPAKLAGFVLETTREPLFILLLIAAVLLVVGCFMETVSAIIIFTPLFLPLAKAAGISPIHLGMVVVMTLVVGVITPPVGIVLFILERISGMPLDKVIRAVLPFYVPLIIAILLVVFFPQLSLWLPGLFLGR
jgi:tripartite ATP-independent transporter DctM subunit